MTLTTRGEATEISTGSHVEISYDQPLEILRRQLGELVPAVDGLPFAGGAIGFFGYDLGAEIRAAATSSPARYRDAGHGRRSLRLGRRRRSSARASLAGWPGPGRANV